MAGPPLLDTGQFNVIMYLFIFILPIIVISLMHSFFPKNPKSLRFLKISIFRGTPWAFRGHRGSIWHRRRKVKTKVKNRNPETTTATRHRLQAHLFAFTMASLKVDCQLSRPSAVSASPIVFTCMLLLASRGNPQAAKFFLTQTHFQFASIFTP